MGKSKDPTLREAAADAARSEFYKLSGAMTLLVVEREANEEAASDVETYRAVRLADGKVRGLVLYLYPGRDKSLLHQVEGTDKQVAKWFRERGVPCARLLEY